MQKQFFQSQVTDLRNTFTETFGRGCLIKQPSFSERNNFQRQKINAEKIGRYRQQNVHEERMKEIGAQFNNKRKEAQQTFTYNKQTSKELESIDQINNTICGLIKSISASCHKKNAVDIKHDKTNDRNSSKKPYGQSNSIPINALDIQKTQKFISHDIKKQQMQSRTFYYHQQEKSIISRPNFFQAKGGTDDEGYDDLNERIKKINDKISNYEERIKYSIKGNIGERPTNLEKNVQREYPSYNRAHRPVNNTERKQSQIKVNQQRMRYIMNEKQNEYPIQKYCQSTQLKKVGKNTNQTNKRQIINQRLSNRTEANFKKQDQVALKQIQTCEKTQKTARDARNNSKVENDPINIINERLLSYKTQFLKQLVKQIRFDQDFRHAKHMFGGIEDLFHEGNLTDGQKWSNLQEQLKRQGFNMPLSEVLEIFMPRDDEIDPFMSVSHSHQELVHGLIYSYRACQKNWNQNIYHNWSLWQLKESKFTAQNLDQSKRGSITLEDLTFYLNSELDGSYRNRDLMLIFNRLKPAKGKDRNVRQKGEQSAIRFKDMVDKLLST